MSNTLRKAYGALVVQLICTLACANYCVAQDEDTPEAEAAIPQFESDVYPILKKHCLACHSGATPKADLDLSLRSSILKGGKSGPAIRLASAETSLIWEKLAADKMPPSGDKLTSDEKGIIRNWIAENAPGKDEDIASDDAENVYPDADYEHWAFKAPIRPTPPVYTSDHDITTAIDSFIYAKLDEQGLTFSPEASRQKLIRRLYLDLLGVPPTPEQVSNFIADESPMAYEELVEKLLSDARYGERWARHWLDAAGYADSAGVLYADQQRTLIYKYRNWVIKSLNSNIPFDDFITLQLAGDEVTNYWDHYNNSESLPVNVIDGLTATGFLRTAPDSSRPDFNTIKNVEGLYYYPTIDAQLEVITSSLMGITFKCAKCHNHKFDPLTQKEYYELQSVFMTVYDPKNWVAHRDRTRTTMTKMEEEASAAAEKIFNEFKKQEEDLRKEYVEKLYQKRLLEVNEQVREDVDVALNAEAEKRTEIQKYLADKFKGYVRVPLASDTLFAEHFPEYNDKWKPLTVEIEKQRPLIRTPDNIFATYDVSPSPESRLLYRGDAQLPGPKVTPSTPRMIPTSTPYTIPETTNEQPTSYRRLNFAKWLTADDHPLTARVFVNRIWMQHFGEGIVRTVDDFGWAGDSPTHPELLDWLAVEFQESGWDIKNLHRLILNSRAYRQQSAMDTPESEGAATLDPTNKLIWKQNLRRLEGEALRDSLLATAGVLDPHMFGPAIGVAEQPDGEYRVAEDTFARRRSIYILARRMTPLSFLRLFDQPVMETNCSRRAQSTVSLQMLAVLNSRLVETSSSGLADRATRESNDNPGVRAFELALARSPDANEVIAINEFLAAQTKQHAQLQEGNEVWSYGHGVFNKESGVEFVEFTVFKANRWHAEQNLPGGKLGWVSVWPDGGHVGTNRDSVFRFTAPESGTYRISGYLNHPSPNGNGIESVVVINNKEIQRKAIAHSQIDFDTVEVVLDKGQTIDWLTNMNGELTSDVYQLNTSIELIGADKVTIQRWNTIENYHGPLDPANGNWLLDIASEKALIDLCHMLLSSNEFAYVD